METKPEVNKILIIEGPTSSGKTSLSLEIARKYKAEIISADSRQIYKFMDIGTGKIPVKGSLKYEKGEGFWILDGIKIWGYDLVEPGQYFSAYDFVLFALNKMKDILQNGKKVIVAGGTGFYIDALTGRTALSPTKPDFELRKGLESLKLSELQKRLETVDPAAYSLIDKNNPRRLIRAIEKVSSQSPKSESLPYPGNVSFAEIGLRAPRDLLYSRADAWLEEIWNRGLITETQSLIGSGYGNTPQLAGLVYKSAISFIKGDLSKEEAVQRAKFDLHSYIRRQQTWFNRNPGINWLDISQTNFSQKVNDIVESKVEWIGT